MSNSSNTNVRSARPGPTQHPFHTFIEQMKINAVYTYEGQITTSNCIDYQQHHIMQAHAQQCHKRTRCPFRAAQHNTRNIRRRSTQSQHHHYNVFGQRRWMRLPLHTASNANNTPHTAINATNVPSVCPEPTRTTPVTSDEDQRRAVITVSMYLDSA